MEITTNSPEETRRVAEKLAADLPTGSVVALYGGLGVGKTCFAAGLARGLGVPDRFLPSPTFVLVREYAGRCPLYHMDFYRLAEGTDLDLLGLDEYLFGEGVTVIEWAGKVEGVLPPQTIRVELEYLGGERRRLNIA